jgi:hypothetical protein
MTGAGDVEPLTWRAYAGVGLLWFASTQVLDWGGIESAWPYRAIAAVVFTALGAACWYNARACGSLHCRISGPGYVVVGLVAAASALRAIDVSVASLTVAFLVVAGASLVVEALVGRSRAGSA